MNKYDILRVLRKICVITVVFGGFLLPWAIVDWNIPFIKVSCGLLVVAFITFFIYIVLSALTD